MIPAGDFEEEDRVVLNLQQTRGRDQEDLLAFSGRLNDVRGFFPVLYSDGERTLTSVSIVMCQIRCI